MSKEFNCYYGGDLEYSYGSNITPEGTKNVINSVDLPKSVSLTKCDTVGKKFCVRLEFRTNHIEIPISFTRLSEWMSEVEKQNQKCQEESMSDYLEQKKEMDDEKNTAIDMGMYDIGQEEGELNWLGSDVSNYSHDRPDTPSIFKAKQPGWSQYSSMHVKSSTPALESKNMKPRGSFGFPSSKPSIQSHGSFGFPSSKQPHGSFRFNNPFSSKRANDSSTNKKSSTTSIINTQHSRYQIPPLSLT
jgi:hypothetical protein